MNELDPKQKKYIADHYRHLSAQKIAARLKIDAGVVSREIQQLTALTGRQKIIFTLALILVPIIFLGLLEIGLRVLHYGGDVDLVLQQKINEVEYCYINKKVAKRFFSHRDISVPDARSAVFKKNKSAHTYRIFCLGGSTTAGFPFQYNATFPSLLNDRLDVLFPDKNIEVINVGISAINSYSVLDFTRELVHYSPDLFIIYMGHNEFYGALGIGSTQQIGRNRNWVLFYMQLQKVRLFMLLRDLIGGVQGLFVGPQKLPVDDQTLMERVVQNRQIALNSPDYQIARDYFEKNLTAIIRIAQKSGAQVIASTLVANLADQEPFADAFLDKTTAAQKQQWQAFMADGYALEQAGQPNAALVEYHQAEKIDPTPASLFFRRAKCLQMTGNGFIARKEYIKAKDLDVLRFRASEDFNDVIRQVGKQNQVPVVEMESIIAPYCLDEILGKPLFTDHLHPHFPGYFWMAKAFCQAMAENNCIVAAERWPWQRDKTTDEYRRLAGVTDLDLEIANQRIRKLTAHWPFKKEVIMRENSGTAYDSLLEVTVQELYERKLGWNEAHYRIARFLEKKGDYDAAAREFEAVIKVTPFNYFPYVQLGDLQLRQAKYQEAETSLNKALELSRRLPFAYAKLGMLYFFTGRNQEAVTRLEQAIDINARTRNFGADELAGAHYILSMAYGQIGKLELARAAAENALKIQPNFPEARSVLKKIEELYPLSNRR